MVIYVDVLVFVNWVVDFLLLSLTSVLTRTKLRLWRKILASFTASLFSLYIFLPPLGFIYEILIRVVPSVIAVLIAFGFGSLKSILRNTALLYGASFIYVGIMAGVWMLFKPDILSINNGTVYFNISPLWLITASFIFYVVISVIKKVTERDAVTAQICDTVLEFGGTKVEAKGMLDTGHTLKNLYGSGAVLIIDKTVAMSLFGSKDTENMLSLSCPSDEQTAVKFRIIPIKTVNGESVLPCVKIDRAKAIFNRKTFVLNTPTVVITAENLSHDYSVIIPPEAVQ